MTTLAFDVYGTLIDTTGVTASLESMIGNDAAAFSNLWRAKQLEYSWRYGLMGMYRNFRTCTSQALDYCCAQLGQELDRHQRKELMATYLTLPLFEDVAEGLDQLQRAGVQLYAFSNGVPADLEILLDNAGIRDKLDGIVSVDDKQTYKPNPLLYHYFMEKTGSTIDDAWLISSNGFDVCGAVAAGMHAIWLQRNSEIEFDPWETRPDNIVSEFSEISKMFL